MKTSILIFIFSILIFQSHLAIADDSQEGDPWSLNFTSPKEFSDKFRPPSVIKRIGGKESKNFQTVIVQEIEAQTYDVWIQPIFFYSSKGKHGQGCDVQAIHVVWVGSCLVDRRDTIDLPVPQDALKTCKKFHWELYPEYTIMLPAKHIDYLGCQYASLEIAQYALASHKEMTEKFMPKVTPDIFKAFTVKAQKFF